MHHWGKRNKQNTTYTTYLRLVGSFSLLGFCFCVSLLSPSRRSADGCVNLCRSARSPCVWSTACSSAIVPESRRRRNATCAASSPVTPTHMSTVAEQCVYTLSPRQHVMRFPQRSPFSIGQVQSFHNKPNWPTVNGPIRRCFWSVQKEEAEFKLKMLFFPALDR